MIGTLAPTSQPTLSVYDAHVMEGNSGTTNLVFTVSLLKASDQTVSVQYTTVDISAKAGSDYGATSGTLTFAPGETTKTVAVPVYGDVVYEENQQLYSRLSGATNATIERTYAIGTIIDDDAAPSVAISDVSKAEGNSGTTNLTFTLNLSGATEELVFIQYATADGTAKAPGDYAATVGSLTFAPGETTKTIVVAVVGDATYEADETFFRQPHQCPVDATAARSQAVGHHPQRRRGPQPDDRRRVESRGELRVRQPLSFTVDPRPGPAACR